MKKIALLLACLMLAACTAVSCGEADTPDDTPNDTIGTLEGVGEYTRGTWAEGKYASDWIGLEFTPLSSMYLSTDEEIELLQEVSADLYYVDEDEREAYLNRLSVELMATDTDNNSVILMTEKLTDGNYTTSDHIALIKEQVDAQFDITATYLDQTEVTLAGQTYTRFAYVVSYEGVDYLQVMYLRKIADRMVSITIYAENDEAEADILACFKAK